jgi:uncharacterized membrane protein HdeD (DUF308 family)
MIVTSALTPPHRLHARRRVPALAAGIAMLGLAGLSLAYPGPAVVTFGGAGGWLLWFAGAVMLGFSLLMFSGHLRIVGCMAALAAVGAGAWLTFNPGTGAIATAMLFVAALITDGAAQLAAALHLRPLRVWRWLLASAVASLAAAALVASGAGQDATVTAAWVLALAFGTTGAALLSLAFSPRADANGR